MFGELNASDDKIPEAVEKFASHGTINDTEYHAINKTEPTITKLTYRSE
jgi:hypothetical protein